jgi:hypothetical protein
MSLNPADSLPPFQLINVGFYSGAGAPSLVSSTLVALYFRTDGGTSTSVYVTLNNGTSWAAITSA